MRGLRGCVIVMVMAGTVLLPSVPANAVAGTLIRYLDPNDNAFSFKVNPAYDSSGALMWGSDWGRRNCTNFATTFTVHVDVAQMASDTAHIGTLKLSGHSYKRRKWYTNGVSTAYYRPSDGEFVAGPGIGPRTFKRGEYNSFSWPFARRIELTRNTKWLSTQFEVYDAADESNYWCWVNLNPVFYKRG